MKPKGMVVLLSSLFLIGGELGSLATIPLPMQSVQVASEENKVTTRKVSGEYTVAVGVLKVRSGADTTYEELGTLTHGKKIKVTGKTNNGWYRFKFNGKTAYANCAFIKPVKKE